MDKDNNHSTLLSHYDVTIVGGGLAGLALSILLNRSGFKVILIEKERYPFHRVCGEYISNESTDFLKQLGVDPVAMNASTITTLQISSPRGLLLNRKLPLGGFGISRYTLDQKLADIASREGVSIAEGVKVNDLVFIDDQFIADTTLGTVKSRIACCCYGKRSNIDIKWKRQFTAAPKNRLNNYIGIKYHVIFPFDPRTVALHTFPGGYCGIVKVEDDRYCLCYLSTADKLQQYGGSIAEMEKELLATNPHLRKIFQQCTRITEVPVTIAQISFDRKLQVEDHALMIGDAAGMITPLCGNGMSMALHGAKMAASQIGLFLNGKISREEMETTYARQWQKEFSARLRTGRIIQRIFHRSFLTGIALRVAKLFPSVLEDLVTKTHGKAF